MAKRKMSRHEKIKIITFAIYNFSYALYMAGYLPRIANYATLLLFIGVCMFVNIKKNEWVLPIRPKRHMQRYGIFIAFVFIFSLGVQLIHLNFGTYLFSSVLYLILPMVAACVWYISTEYEEMEIYFYIFFARLLLHFFLVYGTSLSLASIKMITWGNSKSSIYESSLAHDFLFMTFIFLYNNKKTWAILSTALCLLSFKRLSFVICIALLIGFRFIPKKKCSRYLINAAIIVVSVVPFFYGYMISETGQTFFRYKLGIDLNKLFTGRIYDINRWLASVDQINGYGSISNFINKGYTAGVYSMHCDLYQLYLECSIVAVFLFALFIFKFSGESYHTFFLASYIVLELIVSQFFINFSVWMTFYMFTFMILEERKKLA